MKSQSSWSKCQLQDLFNGYHNLHIKYIMGCMINMAFSSLAHAITSDPIVQSAPKQQDFPVW